MPKFLITKRSHNRITGPIMVTTSPRATCPSACPLSKSATTSQAGGCYAEHGFLGGFIWGKLDQLEPGQTFKAGQIKIYDLPDLVQVIKQLPLGALWRHNQAGDLHTVNRKDIDEGSLFEIVDANGGRKGFTYTHFDVLDNLENRRLVKEANEAGFTVNLSANNIQHAEALAGLGVAPVATVLPADNRRAFKSYQANHVVVCPAQVKKGITCASCGICATQRKAIVGLPAIGAGASRAAADNRRMAARERTTRSFNS